MNYLEHPTKQKSPSRMTRKRARRDVFVKNNKMKKLFKKQRAKDRLVLES